MSNLIKKGADNMIPKDIADMTLRDLMSSKDAEVHKKDNVLKMKRRTPSETIVVEVRSYDDTGIVSQSRAHCHGGSAYIMSYFFDNCSSLLGIYFK